MSCVIIAMGFANGVPCPHEGEYLKAFDFEAYDGQGYGEFTKKIDEAKRFKDAAEAWSFWTTVPATRPLRPDGKPNKPLTALTIAIEPIPE